MHFDLDKFCQLVQLLFFALSNLKQFKKSLKLQTPNL